MTRQTLLWAAGLVLLVLALVALSVLVVIDVWRRRRRQKSAPLPTTLQGHNLRRDELERQREHALRIFHNNQQSNRDALARRTERAREMGTS